MSIDVMNCVWKHAPVQSGEFSVLLALADYADENGSCFPSIPVLARKARLKERQTQNCIRNLVGEGFVHVQTGAGPKGCNRYVVDTAAIEARSITRAPSADPADQDEGAGREDQAGEAGPDDDAAGGANIAPPQSATGGVQPSAPGGALECTQTTIEPPLEPSSEREACASADGQASEPGEGEAGGEQGDIGGEKAETPGTAAFDKRVMRFCAGRGFTAGPWKDWDTSSPGWIGRQFAALSPAERADAERWRDAYLLDIDARGKTPVTVGVFLRDRMWTGLDPMLLARAEKRKMAQLTPEERARPDGWAACRGPVGMAWLFARLAKGPNDAAAMARPLLTDAGLRDAWPAVWWFQAMDRQKGGAIFDPEWHAAKGLMEFVPRETDVLAAWRGHFAERGWKWLHAFDQADGVYCPKGGPEGLEAFERAVRDGARGGEAGGRTGTDMAAGQARKAS